MRALWLVLRLPRCDVLLHGRHVRGGSPVLERDRGIGLPWIRLSLSKRGVLFGSTRIGSRAEKTFASKDGQDLLKSWGVPEGYICRAFMTLGCCDGSYPAAKPRREGRSLIVELVTNRGWGMQAVNRGVALFTARTHVDAGQCPRCFCLRFNFRCSKRASASSARRWLLT